MGVLRGMGVGEYKVWGGEKDEEGKRWREEMREGGRYDLM